MRPLPFVGEPVYAVLFWSTYSLWVALETAASIRKRYVTNPPPAIEDRTRSSLHCFGFR